MRHGDQPLRTLPSAAAHQIHAAVLGDDVIGQAAGIGDHVAGDQGGVDAGNHFALLIGEGRRQADESLAASGHSRRLQKVQLAAGAADLADAGAFGADLAVQVHGNAVVDGHEIIQLAHHRRIVAVGNGICDHARVLSDPVIQILRAKRQAKDALVAVYGLPVVGDLSRLIHV